MKNYQTAAEKAEEWNITTHHVQYLCRSGKIEGAIKRAGVWFIPGDAPIPVKNTKSDAQGFQFVGTKSRVFNSAIELFMLRGFSNVSIKDIADDVGIRQSTIYNHFQSKQEILDTIYDFYCHHYLKNRPSAEAVEMVLRHGSLAEIMENFRYDFQEDTMEKMSAITKIVFQRMAIDDRAREIAKSLIVEEGIRYVEEVWNRAIEIGRFAEFDTHAMAVFINSVRLFVLYCWIGDSSPESIAKLMDDEKKLHHYANAVIKELKPPALKR